MPDGSRVWLDEGTEFQGKYLCSGSQPHPSTIFEAGTKQLQANKRPTPFAMDCYAIEGYCPRCATAEDVGGAKVRWTAKNQQPTLFGPASAPVAQGRWDFRAPPPPCGSSFPMSAANFRFFKTPDPADLRKIEQAESLWEDVKDQLVWPKEHAIPYGDKTREDTELWVHGYHDWTDMFIRRQLLCLAQVLTRIADIPHWLRDEVGQNVMIQESLLLALVRSLDFNNSFTRYVVDTGKIHASMARHDFQPKVMSAECSLWGGETLAQGSFPHFVENVVDGKEFALAPYDNGRVAREEARTTYS